MTVPNVFVATPLSPQSLQMLERDLRNAKLIRALDALPPQRFPADHVGDQAFKRDSSAQVSWDEGMRAADFMLGIPGDGPQGVREIVSKCENIKWVQGTAAGTAEKLEKSEVPFEILSTIAWTSTSGVHAKPLAEFSLAAALYARKDFDVLQRNMVQELWPPRWVMGSLHKNEVHILGAGNIALEIADTFQRNGARVTVLSRKPVINPIGFRWSPISELASTLQQCDILINTLPGGESTNKLISSEIFSMLGNNAIFISVGRGTVVDQEALLQSLDSDRLRYAILDVTDPEPLPASHPLWHHPRVLISPHTAALSDNEDELIVELFLKNLDRIKSGERLINRIDLSQ